MNSTMLSSIALVASAWAACMWLAPSVAVAAAAAYDPASSSPGAAGSSLLPPPPPEQRASSSSRSSSSPPSSPFALPSRADVITALLEHHRHHHHGSTALDDRRVLQEEESKFASLNQIFSGISLKLPDAKVSRSGLDLTITELVCRELHVRDVQISHETESDTSQKINVNVRGMKVNCSFRWEYKWKIFSGRGSGTARLDPSSSASVDLRFLSEDYGTRPPHDAEVPHCRADVQIADMDFDGDGLGIIGGIISLFEGLIGDTVEAELGVTVCDELRGLGDDALDDLLLELGDRIDAYLGPLDADLSDPLLAEKNALRVPAVESGEDEEETLYVNFRELEEHAGEWINSALDQVKSFLGPSGSDDDTSLGINKLIRDNFLDDEGRLGLDPSLFFDSGIVFEGHDMLTQTVVSIESIKIEGLDSFREMDILNAIGKHTLQNRFELGSLHIVAEMEAVMEASSKSNAIIVAPNSPPIREQFTVDFTANGVAIDISMFLGINTKTLGNLELGSILHSQNILPCLISAIDEAEFTGLSVSVSDMVPPKLSGFIDGGIDYLISAGAEALFEMYESVLLGAMPNFFETHVRDLANDFVDDALEGYECPAADDEGAAADRYVDFRDMFLPPAEAALAGGSGGGRYGDVIPWVVNMVEERLFSVDEDGLLAINHMLIGPLTRSQSGTEGAIKFNGTLVDLNKEEVDRDIWKAFADNLRLTLSDLSIAGLDTLRDPIKVVAPRSSSAHLLENQLSLGIPSKPLDMSVRFGLQVGGPSSPLVTDNVMDLRLSMPSMEVLAVLFATVQESRLMEFPLKDILNFPCWLSMMPISNNSASIDVGLALHYFDVLFDGGIRAVTDCVSCSNTWLEDFNSIVEFLDENKFISGLKSKALSIGRDLLGSEWAQGIVDKQIVAASQRCPHDAAFGNTQPNQTYPAFRGTRELVDGILYAAFPLVQVISVVIAQKHSELEIAPAADVELDIPDGANLIDLTDLSSVAGWADMALDEARNYLGGMVDGSRDLGITSMFRSLALDDNGMLTISIEDKGFEAGGVKLSLFDVTMVGLDSFTVFDVLNASGPSTFSNSISLEKLGVTLKMGLSVEDDASEPARMLMEKGIDTKELEAVTVSLILKDVDIDLSLLMAMDQDLMGDMRLGSILDTNHIMFCLLSTIHSVGLSKFVMNIGDIEDFSISGFISEDTNESIRGMTEAIFKVYKPLVLEAIPAFTSNTIRPILHDILQELIDMARDGGACPAPDSALDGIVDYRDLFLSEERALKLLGQGGSPYGDLFQLLYIFLEDMMTDSDNNGLSKMNALIASMTERQSNERGDLFYPGDLFKQDLDISLNGLNAAIELGISDLRVSNLDSLGAPIRVLQPVEGKRSDLNNTASIGVGPDSFRTEFRLLIKGKGDEVEVHNDLVLGLSLKSAGMMLEVLAQIRETPFLNFPLQDVLNMQCWLATIVTPVLDKYGIRVGEVDTGIVLKKIALAVAEARLDIDCITCTSPLIVEMSSKLGSQEAVEDTTAVANMLLEYLSNLVGGDFVQSGLDKMLNEAAMKCPHSPSYNQNFPGLKYEELAAPEQDEDTYWFLIAIIAVVAICLVLVVAVVVITRFVSRRRHNRWVNTLNRSQKLELERMQKDERERENDINRRMTSLVRSKEVPLFLRLFIPVVIIGTIALFLSGHLSLGGTVNISGSFAGQSFSVDGFFEFSMAKSTIEMWKAGAKALAILIVIFSGAWPYTKQLITLFIWFTPPSWLTFKRRGSTLSWLDTLGKWSMVDVFVLLMTLASFRLSVASPDHLDFLPEGLYSINMLVVPMWGLYANMLAQLVAQVSSHVVIHYHRKTTKAAAHAQEVEWGLPTSSSGNIPDMLRSHSFKLDYEASSKHAIVRKSVHWLLLAALLLFMTLVVCGCALPSFGIEVLGLVGLVVESGNQFEQANVFYSVFSLASMIMDQGRYLNTASDLVGLGTLASLLVITVFIVPLAQAASLLAQWFAPMTNKQRTRNVVLNEILSAWQYMEVYVLSIIIAAWQLGGVSEFMINAYCNPLNETFNSLAYYGILDESDAQCFRVDASVQAASWILVAASLILCILNHFIMGASLQKEQDDEVPAERRLHTDRWLQGKQSTATIGMMSMNASMDEEEGSNDSDLGEPMISLVRPRFTDYYFFATQHRTEERSETCLNI